MTQSEKLSQTPAPGSRRIMFRGDTVSFRLTLERSGPGTAWIRTNIGQAVAQRREIIRSVHHDESPLGRDWFDLPMIRQDDRHFTVTLALSEVGHFEAKCYFLPQGESTPLWPPGPNTVVNVEPADACCANTLYNAFVRQFGPNKAARRDLPATDGEVLKRLDQSGFTVIPPSGTFRDLVKELDFIIGSLGCRLLMLLPIHPTPTTYGRMGRFGSPYAALSFTAVDPALAVFDPSATPLEQFLELVDAVHQRNARIIIDIAINHTGWAARLHETHPEWLVRSPEGRIEVPGAWGVQWEDLTKLDYRRTELWQFMAEIFLNWCRRGVDGFRCDAGYMIPRAAWKYIVARVRDQYPDTVFLLEGLGGRISVTRDLLNTANLNWAYSELFQNYDRAQIEHYLPEANDISTSDGITMHFAETHDNPRLASKSHSYARMRTALSALASHSGAFGFANGVEWLATEKINVHEAPSLNWGSDTNQIDHIKRLTLLLRAHPAFFDRTELSMIQAGTSNHLVLLRHHRPSGKKLLVVVNLNENEPTTAEWDGEAAGLKNSEFTDLIASADIRTEKNGPFRALTLAPGQVMCLTPDKSDLELLAAYPKNFFALPPRIEYQRRRAKVMEIVRTYHGTCDLTALDVRKLAETLRSDPAGLCRQLNPNGEEPRVVRWQWPRDGNREVMVPPGHFLLVTADDPFRASLIEGRRTRGVEDSLPQDDGSYFVLFSPPRTRPGLRTVQLSLSVYGDDKSRHASTPLMLLPRPETARHQTVFRRPELRRNRLVYQAANTTAAATRVPVAWGELTSRYDALLAANLNPDHPEDRWVMLTRCRLWLVYQGYSQHLNRDCLQQFNTDSAKRGNWRFLVPCGQGQHVAVTVTVSLAASGNHIELTITRHGADKKPENLPDEEAVQIIVRPDIEDRSFHATTKAYTGPETSFGKKIKPGNDGFAFIPESSRRLQVKIFPGKYIPEPEWHYMVHRELEAERGLDPDSDLFSPGYFRATLDGGSSTTIAAAAAAGESSLTRPVFPIGGGADHELPEGEPLVTLTRALDMYVVNRGRLKSVIAGYPWFLDWGRDALIFTRGLIETGDFGTAREILLQFGQFEEHGTLPNMIAGSRAANRDTSDAPLWFFTACNDLLAAEGSESFLDNKCGSRKIHEILTSIGTAIAGGTFNGVRMDPASALVYSPAHFTWMDTDHPAGTRRQGYPIEIQALWIEALELLTRIDQKDSADDPEPAPAVIGFNPRQPVDEKEPAPDWAGLEALARKNLHQLFWLEAEGYFSDCLHADSYIPASEAIPDDALRPNQLLTISLGAVDDRALARRILAACEELLVPGAIRSLADRPVKHHLAIYHNGELLNDPERPYQGSYTGDEDTRRKPAYHNGTAWTWQFPLFCEAWARAYGSPGEQTALAWLTSSVRLMDSGCVGHLPEIVDGNLPHRQRGCDAQAWGVSEWVRVWTKLVRPVEPV